MNAEIVKLLRELADSLQAEDASLFLSRDNQPDAHLEFLALGKKEILTDLAIPHGKGIAGWVALHGEPVISNDPEKDQRFFDAVDMLSEVRTRSILAVPVVYNDNIIGVIEAINKSGDEGFTESDIEKASETAEAVLPHISEEKIKSIID